MSVHSSRSALLNGRGAKRLFLFLFLSEGWQLHCVSPRGRDMMGETGRWCRIKSKRSRQRGWKKESRFCGWGWKPPASAGTVRQIQSVQGSGSSLRLSALLRRPGDPARASRPAPTEPTLSFTHDRKEPKGRKKKPTGSVEKVCGMSARGAHVDPPVLAEAKFKSHNKIVCHREAINGGPVEHGHREGYGDSSARSESAWWPRALTDGSVVWS